MTIHELLKTQTRPHHDSIEQYSLSDKIMDGTLTLDEYKTLLFKNYIFHASIENSLEKFLKDLPDFGSRKKTGSLLKDLAELNYMGNSFKKFSPPAFKNKAEALGAMYVMEGATLGGAMIYKQLLKNEEIARVSSFNYYRGYGEKTSEKWKSFLQILSDEVKTEDEAHDTLSGAIQTFQAFEKLLKE
ncbi:MAG: biliverdin-producing heme oxygenase [Bacteroidota bacterium]